MRAKSLQLCLTLCNPMDCRLPGSSVHGIFQSRILECLSTPSSRESSHPEIEHWSLLSPEVTGRFFTTSGTWGAPDKQ